MLDIINTNIYEDDLEQNLDLFTSAWPGLHDSGDHCLLKGRILHKIGVTFYLLNRENEAIHFFRDSVLTQWNHCDSVPLSEVANTTYNTGISFQYLNEIDSARHYLDRALTLFERDTTLEGYDLALKYQGLGNFYSDIYDRYRALLYYENAHRIFSRDEQYAVDHFYLLNDVIRTHLNFKNYEEALEVADKAIRLYEQHQTFISQLDYCLVLLNTGIAYLETNRPEDASRFAKNALNQLKRTKDIYLESIGKELLAMSFARMDSLSLAKQTMLEVLDLRRDLIEDGYSGELLLTAKENLIDILINAGEIQSATDSLQTLLKPFYASDKNDLTGLPFDRFQLIRLLELQTDIERHNIKDQSPGSGYIRLTEIHNEVDIVFEKLLAELVFENSRLDIVDLAYDFYGKAVSDAVSAYRVLKEETYAQKAYYYASKLKAVNLRLAISDANALNELLPDSISGQIVDLRAEIISLEEAISTADSSASIREELALAQERFERLLSEVRADYPIYQLRSDIVSDVPPYQDIQMKLEPGTAVIDFFSHGDTIYAFWLTTDMFRIKSIPYSDSLERALDIYINNCYTPEIPLDLSSGEYLYNELLNNGLVDLSAINRLSIIPDDKLYALSFEALPASIDPVPSYVIEQYEVTYAYSSGLLFGETVSSDGTYAGFATSYTDSLSNRLISNRYLRRGEALSRLAYANLEVESGAAIMNGEKYIGADASIENFKRFGRSSDILHLSLHGLADQNEPAKSCLIFDDRNRDFVLSALDLYTIDIQSTLVIMSACHSADGKLQRGEGIQGMSRSFLMSGTKNVISSLWDARETSAMNIVESFLRKTKSGYKFASALRESKLEYINSATPAFKHPYFWANLVLIGKTEPGSTLPIQIRSLVILFALLITGGLFYLLRKRINRS